MEEPDGVGPGRQIGRYILSGHPGPEDVQLHLHLPDHQVHGALAVYRKEFVIMVVIEERKAGGLHLFLDPDQLFHGSGRVGPVPGVGADEVRHAQGLVVLQDLVQVFPEQRELHMGGNRGKVPAGQALFDGLWRLAEKSGELHAVPAHFSGGVNGRQKVLAGDVPHGIQLNGIFAHDILLF